MGRKSKFSLAKGQIKAYLKRVNKKVYSLKDIVNVFDEMGESWDLAKSATPYTFLYFLLAEELLVENEIHFPTKIISSYIYFDTKESTLSHLYIALHSIDKSYLSHYSSLAFHNLTEQALKVIYITSEQSKKVKKSNVFLEQKNIDSAFSKPQRITTNKADFLDSTLFLLNGMYTKNLGVIKKKRSDEEIYVTNIERTLIDIVVRPAYAGGISEVLKAYTKTKGKVSINKLVSMLNTIGFVYPYHQCIGFYMERSGVFSENQIARLYEIEQINDFYLTYNIRDKEYSKKWRLYYPKNF